MSIKPCFPCAGPHAIPGLTRREFIYGLSASLGSVAFSSLLAEEAMNKQDAPKQGHLPAKAKNVIFLMM